MMYTVSVLVRGYIYLNVEAENKQEAERIADEDVGNIDYNRLENIEVDVVDAWEENA